MARANRTRLATAVRFHRAAPGAVAMTAAAAAVSETRNEKKTYWSRVFGEGECDRESRLPTNPGFFKFVVFLFSDASAC